MKAEIISVGDELTLGMIADSNSAYLSSKLASIGITVARHTVVGDDLQPIIDAVRSASHRANLIIINGGIGPTVDDLTRQAVAQVAGVEMRLDPEWLETIRSIFARRNIQMPQSNAIQAMIPANATRITNPCGTAAGFFLSLNGAEIAVFPGVPGELRAMFELHYLPRLAQTAPTGQVIITRTLKCFGLPESLINDKIRHLMGTGKNPLVGLLAKDYVISVKITATAPDEPQALAMIHAAKVQTRTLLSQALPGEVVAADAVFGEDDDELETAVARILVENNITICTAESCTGGLIAKRLTDIPGSSAFFLGGVITYSNQSKIDLLGVPAQLIAQHGAVSPEVARTMAENIRTRINAHYALAVTGIAGPTGGTIQKPVGLVYVALASADRATLLLELHLTGTRHEIRDRAAKFALNMVRTQIQPRI